MSNHKKPRTPSYRLHKQSGQAIVTLTNHFGTRRDVLLGKYDTPESRAEYRRVVMEWAVNDHRLPEPPALAHEVSVNEILLAYWEHVQTYYRLMGGTPSTEVDNIRLALRPLKALYGHTPAAKFDSTALETVREQMIRDGRCRNRINKDVARVKRLFKWSGSKKLLPSSIYQDLNTVEGSGRAAPRRRRRPLSCPCRAGSWNRHGWSCGRPWPTWCSCNWKPECGPVRSAPCGPLTST
jgi:hypothetical protein